MIREDPDKLASAPCQTIWWRRYVVLVTIQRFETTLHQLQFLAQAHILFEPGFGLRRFRGIQRAKQIADQVFSHGKKD
jgi:hypothetical protein